MTEDLDMVMMVVMWVTGLVTGISLGYKLFSPEMRGWQPRRDNHNKVYMWLHPKRGTIN